MENPIWSWGSNKFSALGAGTHKKASATLTRSLLFNLILFYSAGHLSTAGGHEGARQLSGNRCRRQTQCSGAGSLKKALRLGRGRQWPARPRQEPARPGEPAPAQNKLRSTNARIICGFAKASSLTPTRVSNGREEQAMQRSPKWRTGSSTWESWRSGSLRRSRCEPEPLEP